MVFRFIFWYPLRGLAPFLPEKIASCLAALSAVPLYLTDRERVRILREELRRIINRETGHKAVNRAVRRSLVILCKSRMDLFRFKKQDNALQKNPGILEGKQKLDSALEMGNGAMILTPHFGSHLTLLPLLHFSGYRVNQFATRQTVWKDIPGARKDFLFHRALDIADKLENAIPVRFIYQDDSIKTLFRCLENNEILVMGFDGRMGKRWEPLPFLGRTAHFSRGFATIAEKTGAPVFLSFAVRSGEASAGRIILEGPWRFDKGGAEAEAVLGTMVSCVESYVKAYPCHYGEFLRLMRTRRDMDDPPFFKEP